MIWSVRLQMIDTHLATLAPLIDVYAKGDPNFVPRVLAWLEESEKMMSRLHLPEGAEMSSLRGQILKAADTAKDEEGRPTRRAIRHAQNAAAADALTRTEALLQARAREAEQKLEHYEEKLVQAVTAAGLIKGTIPPPTGESREKWLRQIWANLTRHDALRPTTMYLASALTAADRLVLLDRIMSRLLEPDLPVLSYQ
jgi:hypothetical protein